MAEDRAKADEDDHRVDPAVKDRKANDKGAAQPVSPAGSQRRENESSANRDNDGQRKRAEEGL